MVFDTGMDYYDSDYYNLDACMDDDDLDCPEYCVAAFGSTHFPASNHDRMIMASLQQPKTPDQLSLGFFLP